jgi:hypothetical protein
MKPGSWRARSDAPPTVDVTSASPSFHTRLINATEIAAQGYFQIKPLCTGDGFTECFAAALIRSDTVAIEMPLHRRIASESTILRSLFQCLYFLLLGRISLAYGIEGVGS